MNRRSFAVSLIAFGLVGQASAAPPPKKPKLLLTIVVDQFRYDYLTRFRSQYTAGLARLLEKGAVFTNAYYEHFPTVTAIGHSTVLSGATPSISGIVGNEWYDRETAKQVTSVSDSTTEMVGAQGRGSSPRRLLVSTVADELKMSGQKSKVIGISSKDRSAILTVGRMADAAYWFDSASGNFVTSTYYMAQQPEWAAAFNKEHAVDKWAGKQWTAMDAKPGDKPIRTLGTKLDKVYYDTLERTPWGNDIVEMFAEAAIVGEKLGTGEGTDVLAVSFSTNDRIGHNVGPDSHEVREVSIATDRTIGRLLDFVDQKIGADNYIVVMTADHGVAPLPEVMQQRKMSGGRLTELNVIDKVRAALIAKYGEGQWVLGKSGPAPYLNHALIREKNLNLAEVQEVAADVVRAMPHISRVYTQSQLSKGQFPMDMIGRRVNNGYHTERASDLFIVIEPYWLFEKTGTSHGTPYNYDAHVPVVFMGPGIKPGKYHAQAAVNDIAPTLATLLEVETPSGSAGRVLAEILVD